jgi:hypothetical protein
MSRNGGVEVGKSCAIVDEKRRGGEGREIIITAC